MNQTSERTEVICIIDRSGSMEPIRLDAIGGFNTFLKEQQAIPGDCRLTLILFNDQIQVVTQSEDIRTVKPLSWETYVPAGSTALLDAIAYGLHGVKERILEQSRPRDGYLAAVPATKVIVVILTDGEENGSTHTTREGVFARIKKCREKFGWEFLFLAANQDAIKGGASIGIDARHSVGFTADSHGAGESFNSMSHFVGNSRSGFDSGNSGGNLH